MLDKTGNDNTRAFVELFRNASPYVNAHRGKTFVLAFGGEALEDERFDSLIHDIAILNSLGIRLVLVHGARPQIERRMKHNKLQITMHNGLRITDVAAMGCITEASGCIRIAIESRLSMGLTNTPMSGARIRVASGNFVIARPRGICDGVDFQHTGEVRRLDSEAIQTRLQQGDIVLLSPLGYSPSGEIFNLDAEDVATAAAIELQADKLLFLLEGKGPVDGQRKSIRELSTAQAQKLLDSKRKLSAEIRKHLASAVHACRFGVRRAHLIQRKLDGALIQELFSRDGAGTLITGEMYEEMRVATINDVPGIIELLKPLEDEGILVKRSRELLELEIEHFTVIERDGMVIGCVSIYPYSSDGMVELACLAVHPDYHKQGRGERLLDHVEKQAHDLGLDKMFVLTTRTAHWFQERGFRRGDIKTLPMKRKQLYNYQRNSSIYIKNL